MKHVKIILKHGTSEHRHFEQFAKTYRKILPGISRENIAGVAALELGMVLKTRTREFKQAMREDRR